MTRGSEGSGRWPDAGRKATARHAFSLPPPRAAISPTGWRSTFADAWTELALRQRLPVETSPRGRQRVLRHASALIGQGHQRLAWALGPSATLGADATVMLRCAATVLEGSAIVWEAVGPAGGERRLHLLRRLEHGLERVERDLLCAEIGVDLPPSLIALPGRRALRALDRLAATGRDPAPALAVLEDGAVTLAMVGVCAASNVQRFGTPRPAPQASSTRLLHDLHAVGHEVAAAADRRRPRPAPAGHVGTWLAEALGVPVPTHDLALASDCDTDPVLRTDSLLAIRCNWVALASALLLAIVRRARVVTVVPAKYEERLAWRVRTHESKALEAAVTLFERIEPNTIDEAVQQICPDRRSPSDVFDVIADAWSLYRHIADMPCD